jgi:hypothetical protein
LAIVSILGFLGIASKTLFELDIDVYIEFLWILTLGIGLLMEVDYRGLRAIKQTGLTQDKFTNLITVVVGGLAIITGLVTLPIIGWATPGLLAIKGVISLVAIVFIVIQTWVLKA